MDVLHKQNYLKTEKTQYKALKIVYSSNKSYEELLLGNSKVSICQKNLRILVSEVFKSLTDINPDFMNSYFTLKEIPYCLRNGNFLEYHQHALLVMEKVRFYFEHA